MTVLWDWNGTLVADVPLVVKLNNMVFAQHGYKDTTEEEYRRLFRFPVREYYRDLGVTDEDFVTVANEWSAAYAANFHEAPLAQGAAEAVHRFHHAGLRQVILSASPRDLLVRQVAIHHELDGMFDEILGLADVYAVSKVQLALDFLARGGVNPDDAVFLGDTTHDAEVARAIGCRCFLIAGGHQEQRVLERAGVPILRSALEACDMLGV